MQKIVPSGSYLMEGFPEHLEQCTPNTEFDSTYSHIITYRNKPLPPAVLIFFPPTTLSPSLGVLLSSKVTTPTA